MTPRSIVLLFLGLCCAASARLLVLPVAAQAHPAEHRVSRGIAANGLCGLIYAEDPLCPTHVFAVTAGVGYGHTESLPENPGAHSRAAGTLGVGVMPLVGVALSLRLDGRWDAHPPDEDGADRTMVGDPRVQLRLGRALDHGVALGVSAGAWVPGTAAPSLDFTATSLDLKLLASARVAKTPWSVLGTLGFRWDNSAQSAPADRRRLRTGDRLSLNLSDYDALLWVFALRREFTSRGEAFVDVSGDFLVGGRATPPARQSPWRVSVGGRYFPSNRLQLELSLSISLSQRASLAATSPWVPMDPRWLLSAGFRFGLPRELPVSHRSNQTPASAPAAPTDSTSAARSEPVAPAERRSLSAALVGRVLDATGVPVLEARVQLRIGAETIETITDGRGQYQFAEVPLGTAALQISATGFVEQNLEISVTPEMSPLPAHSLEAAAPSGLLRCVTRTFTSEPLRAVVAVQAGPGNEVAKGESDEHGLFEIQLPPGSYQVIISAVGHRVYRRTVRVSANGVAILNLDMRELD